MKLKEMNGHQKAAARAIKRTYNEYVGGWYNCYQDGYNEDIPSLSEAKSMVLHDAIIYEPKEMRFAGTEFCEAYMEYLFEKDPDVAEIPWADEEHETKKEDENMAKNNAREEARAYILKNYTVKEMREHLKAEGVKGISRAKKEKLIEMMLDVEEQKDSAKAGKTVSISKVKMFAFTGMFLGEFEAEVQNGKILVYTTSKGELMFDLETGKEITDANKARYANRVKAV